jgi:hypothetical protein
MKRYTENQNPETRVSKKIKMSKTNLIEACLKLRRQKKGIKSFLRKEGVSDIEARKILLTIKKPKKKEVGQITLWKEEDFEDKNWKSGLKYTEKYVYNKEDDKYVVYLKTANSNIVLPGDTVRGIFENYSNWYDNEKSINEICRNYRIPRNYFKELKEVFGITHDSEPVTPEELVEKDISSITDDILQKKKFQLHQEFQKKSWQQTEEAASKWFKFEEGLFNPLVNFLSGWNPPAYSPVKCRASRKNTQKSKSLIVGLSDVHFGAKTNRKESFRNKGYSSSDAVGYLKKYTDDIANLVESRNYRFDECVLTSLGDILHTTGAGFTTKGTMLVHDCIKEEQFNYAFNSILEFISGLLELFPRVTVKSVKGNHNDFGDYVLFKALAAYFRTESRINFDVFEADHGMFKVKKCLFIISHGYSAEYKGRIPSSSKARESYIANLFLSRPQELIGVEQKVLLTADQHHLEMKEYAEFEHYMLSTTVKGDKHSEAMGLNNIPRQSCFVLDEEGVKEVVYCYGK